MLNTHALTNPSPADQNLRTGNHLGMHKGGSNSTFFHATNRRTINSADANLEKRSMLAEGIIPFSLPTIGGHHPIPFKNALIDKPLPVYDLYHSPIAPQFNPLALSIDTDFVKKYNTVIQK